jgi:hypothetical protein
MPTKIVLGDKTFSRQQALILTSDEVELLPIDPESVDSEILRNALKRARERLNGEITARHNSHHSHHSHGTAAW